jgi:hypothetical protein
VRVRLRARVQPLLVPRTVNLEDYVTGSKSVFDGDPSRDRALIHGLIAEILIYEDGSIVLRFKESTLFEPVRTYTVHPNDRAPGSLADERQAPLDGWNGAAKVADEEGTQVTEILEAQVKGRLVRAYTHERREDGARNHGGKGVGVPSGILGLLYHDLPTDTVCVPRLAA